MAQAADDPFRPWRGGLILNFNQLVRQQLKQRRMSIRRISRLAEMDPSFFAKVLRGERQPPNDEKTLRRLAEALSLEPARLMLSVGRIPAEWQAKTDRPEVITALKNIFEEGSWPSKRERVVPRQTARSRVDSMERSPASSNSRFVPKMPSPDLSEDLL